MVTVQGGVATIGTAPSEKGHKADEGPIHKVSIDPFWMGRYEITWEQFELFVYTTQVDAVTKPTPPFTDMSFGMGKSGYPAVNMTQHAALAYCKWLTAKTGHFYRLPTEAEWEYACRAGTTTAYNFGDDPAQLSDYAWYSKNSKEKYNKVGTRKPNAWGLYDMHGNVSEWTLDQYIPGYYSSPKSTAKNSWAIPSKLYPRVVRGGSWDDDPESLRAGARLGSSAKWKQRDPQIPKSDWWNTDASFLGFRIVRPLNPPPPKEIEKYFARQPKDL